MCFWLYVLRTYSVPELSCEYVAAYFTVTWAEFVGLQSVENTQGVFRVTANVQVGCVNVLDGVFVVDDEGVTVCNAVWRTNAEAVDQGTVGVSKCPDWQLVEIRVIAAPCQLNEFVVGRAAENNCVTVFELTSKASEFSDFGWANESEVFWVKEDYFPLTFEAFFSVIASNALSPFSSWLLKPGFTPTTSNSGSFSPIPTMVLS